MTRFTSPFPGRAPQLNKESIMNIKGFPFKPVIVLITMISGFGAYLITQKNDSPIEQATEAVLRTQGIDIDFSPNDD